MYDEALTAVKKGNLKKLKELLDQGINVNVQDANGRTLLHHAVSDSKHEIVQHLLKNGADVLVTTDKNNTVLHIAVAKDDHGMLMVILKNASREKLKTLLDAKTKATGTTALHIAAKNGHCENVTYLLEFGANFEVTNNNSEKPVDVATTDCLRELFGLIDLNFRNAKNDNEQLISDLEKCDIYYFLASVNCRNNEGHTMMQIVVKNNSEMLLRLVWLRSMMPVPEREFTLTYAHDRLKEMDELAEQIEKYMEFWSTNAKAVITLAVYNIFKNSPANVLKMCCRVLGKAHEVFLKYRQFSGEMSLTANVKMKAIEEILEVLGLDPDKLCADDDASYFKKLPGEWKDNLKAFIYLIKNIITYLIDYFSQNLKTIRLTLAVNDGDVEKVQQLLDSGTYFEQADHNNRTVLGYAAENGHKKIVNLLLKAGAKVLLETNQKLPARRDIQIISPLYLAANNGHAKIVKLLLKNVDSKDIAKLVDCQHGVKRAALHAAAKKGYLDVVKILLSYGATYEIVDGKNRTPLDVSTDEDVSAFLKIVDECFHDAKKGNVELVQKLKAMDNDEFKAVANARNSEGYTLAVVAAQANAKSIAVIILRMIKEAKQDQD